jgi:glycosyltransferase involved in cell wall biosynthesis
MHNQAHRQDIKGLIPIEEKAARPIILAFVSYYLPGYRAGGPIRTIANMVDQLGADFDFRIITTDRDLGDIKHYHGVQIDAWNNVGKAKVFYASRKARSFISITRLIRETPHDILYLNSFFDPSFTIKPIIAGWLGIAPQKTTVIAPRGEFSDGALAIKAWKKKPFVMLVRILSLYNCAKWHASTEFEAADIKKALGVKTQRVTVARNITVAPDLLESVGAVSERTDEGESETGRLRICFLSRISAMKNLEFALRVINELSVPVDFHIYGPKEDAAYWERCEAVIAKLPAHVQATYRGSVDHANVKIVIAQHDIFFVPSLGENYGHVFMESLASGVPILVSDQTPWRELSSKGVGWDIPLDDPQEYINVIEQFARTGLVERQKIRQKCLKFAAMKAADGSALELNKALFYCAMSQN